MEFSATPLSATSRRRAFVAVYSLSLVASSSAALAQEPIESNGWWSTPAVGLGPILLRSQSPLSLLRLTPTPLQPVTTPRGDAMVGAVVDWNNYFALDAEGRYLVDAESVGLTVGAAFGLTDRLDVHASLPIAYRGGGVLDGFVEGFESFIGRPNEDRYNDPRDRYLVRIVRPDGTVVERHGSDAGWALEDPAVGIRYQLHRGSARAPSVLLAGGLKLPFGNAEELHSSGGVDAYLALALGQRLGPRFHLYASLAGMRYGETEVAGIDLRRSQWSFFGGLEFRRSTRTSWLLQGVVTSAGTRSYGGFAESTFEVTLGIKHLLRPDLLLEVSVLENLFVFNNSPDVGFHFGVVKRLQLSRENDLGEQ